MEEYLRSLRQQLKSFPAEERIAIMAELRSHAESAEADPRMGRNGEERRDKLMKELGSPEDMGKGFKALYRPSRFIDYLLILIPFLIYPYLNSFYATVVIPRYAGGALLLDVIIHLPLVLIGWLRRSAVVTLFWAAILISQLCTIVGRLYGYYGLQTTFWAIFLIALLTAAARALWSNRDNPLAMAFGLLMVGMAIAGGLLNTLAMVSPFALWIWRGGSGWAGYAANGMVDRSLLDAYIHVRDTAEFYSVLALALFVLPTRREIRWLGLGLAGLLMGLGHRYLLDYQVEPNLLAPWIYILWVILPLAIVTFGLWLSRSRNQQIQPAT